VSRSREIKALGLTSGGLDSILSALLLRDQGIHVTWVSFKTPFFSPDAAIKAAARYLIPLRVEEITDVYMDMLKNPPGGYGKNMNPCMDCHALMFARAGKIMEQDGFDFLFSGEVEGQRPFSQNKRSMRYVEKRSGFDGSILRPLSARVLPETEVEIKGLVDRERLGAISGRSRKKQIEMAKHFNVTDYPAPAGGCKLTDPAFSARLRDLLLFQKSYEENDLYLLDHGRHFRLDPETRIIVGRSEMDNNMIENFYSPEKHVMIRMDDMPGPLVLIPSSPPTSMVKRAGAFCAAYARTVPGQKVGVLVKSPSGRKVVMVAALDNSTFQAFAI